MLVIASALVLSEDTGVNLTHPLIGYHNLVTAGGIAATTEDADFPASNLANPATHLKWKASPSSPPADEYITITTGSLEEIDYVAVARHNWGSNQNPVSIGYWDASSPPVWVELVQEQILPDDGPALFRFEPQVLATVLIRLQPGIGTPEAAVVYCGKLLVMERSFPAPGQHAPLDFGRENSVVNGMSESGNFLGRVVVGAHNESAAEFQHLTPDWYRTYFEPFMLAAKAIPFFLAWNPEEYEAEVGFAWLTASPKPAQDTVTRRMNISLPMRGVT